MNTTNVTEKFELITEHWRPKVIAELNGQEVKLANPSFAWVTGTPHKT